MERLRRFLEDALWPRLEIPLAEIIVHVVVTFFAILSIGLIELVLYLVHLDGRVIPGSGVVCQWLGVNEEVTLGELMLALEVLAASGIIVVGIVKAVVALGRSRS
ncbi:MAG: hypothetical protein L0Y50_02685 [Beijerinckiaceae bacterium]|nr:hypothetical protein [Beijerinckiaceae bacterium]MCI0735173.1 hypothetical protein [Beijerinckiaceae bacterium]